MRMGFVGYFGRVGLGMGLGGSWGWLGFFFFGKEGFIRGV
jgi:hypothetical protein